MFSVCKLLGLSYLEIFGCLSIEEELAKVAPIVVYLNGK